MPYRFSPIGANSSFSDALPVINNNFAQLDQEAITKTFKQAKGNSVVTGKLPGESAYGTLYYDVDGNLVIREGSLPYDGGYGSLYYKSGIPGILIGIAPDGEMDIAASIDGVDITDLYT